MSLTAREELKTQILNKAVVRGKVIAVCPPLPNYFLFVTKFDDRVDECFQFGARLNGNPQVRVHQNAFGISRFLIAVTTRACLK